ncbi:MAG: hypothetical protein LBE91_16210 [Tannerella sp.]|jgi:hypothetical protein|nr:hypothetical protein [Tannerella sp.]
MISTNAERTTGGLAQLGSKVFARISVRLLTAGVSPNCVRLNPQLRQTAFTLSTSGRQCSETTKTNIFEKFLLPLQ